MGSMQHQEFLLQRETTPGTPLVNAMRRYQGLKMMPGYGRDGGQSYTASGFRGTTARVKGDEYGNHSIEPTPDFNAALPILASIFGMPVTTQPDAVNAAGAYQHVFTLMGRGKRNPVSFTAQWGDEDYALQLAYFLFNTLTLGVQRGELTFESSAFSKEGDDTISLATAGVTEVVSVPWDPTEYDVFSDDLWADLGTTQLLDYHEGSISVGETWGRSSPINSAIVSFAKALENEDVEYSGSMSLAFDAVLQAMMATFKNGAQKFMRLAQDGPLIGGAIRYGIMIDYGIRITERGEFGSAPNSSEVVLSLTYELSPDAVSGKLIEITLVNTVATV